MLYDQDNPPENQDRPAPSLHERYTYASAMMVTTAAAAALSAVLWTVGNAAADALPGSGAWRLWTQFSVFAVLCVASIGTFLTIAGLIFVAAILTGRYDDDDSPGSDA